MAANREETTHGRTPDRPPTSKGLFINVVIGLARPPELPMIGQVLWQNVNQLYEKFVQHKRSLRMCFLCCYFLKTGIFQTGPSSCCVTIIPDRNVAKTTKNTRMSSA